MRNILSILFLLVTQLIQAQTAKTSLKLEKKEDILEVTPVGQSGFILRTGVSYASKNEDERLHRYDKDLTRLWSISLGENSDKLSRSYTVASEYSEYTYRITGDKSFSFRSNKLDIYRINNDGDDEHFRPDLSALSPKVDVDAMFAGKDYLYMLFTDYTNEKTTGGRLVYLYRLPHEGKKIEDLEIAFEVDKIGDFRVIGFDGERVFLQVKKDKLNSVVYIYNLDGSLENELELSPSISASLNPEPAYNQRHSRGNYFLSFDFNMETRTKPTINYFGQVSTKEYTVAVPNNLAYGNLHYSPETGKFYMYGLVSSKKAKFLSSSKPDKLYMTVFNLDGERLSTDVTDLPDKVKKDGSLIRDAVGFDRDLSFIQLDSSSYRIQLGYGSNVYSMLFMNRELEEFKTLKVITRRNNLNTPFEKDMSTVYASNLAVTDKDASPALNKFLTKEKYEKLRYRQYSITAINFQLTNIVLINSAFEKEPKVDILLFPENSSSYGKPTVIKEPAPVQKEKKKLVKEKETPKVEEDDDDNDDDEE